MSARLSRRAVLAAGLAGLVAGPGRGESFAPSAATLARPAAPVRSAAGLRMEDETGAPVDLAGLGAGLLVINLWAPWCLPCRREMPSLARLAARLEGSAARVIPLAFDWRGPSGVRRFFREIGVDNLPVLLGDGDNLRATLAIELLPTTILVDAAGRHVATVAGEATWDDDATLDWVLGLAG